MLNTSIFLAEITLLFVTCRFCLKKGEGALSAFICLQAVLANLFVLKQITLFGLDVTAADSFAVGCVMSLGVFQEFFGKDKAKKIAFLSLLAILFFSVITMLHLAFEPSPFDSSQSAYKTLFSISPRISAASFIAFFLSQRTDILFFAYLKNRFPNASLAIRAGISTLTAQALDTAIFSVLGLYGVVHNLWHIMLLSFAIKVLSIFFFSSFLAFFKKRLKTEVSP